MPKANENISGILTIDKGSIVLKNNSNILLAKADGSYDSFILQSHNEQLSNNCLLTKTQTESVIRSTVGSVVSFKGSKATVAELPTTDVNLGDVWFVSATNAEYLATAISPDIVWEELGPNDVVKLTGNQTIDGVKTFSSIPVLPDTPSADNEAANKSYVDSVNLQKVCDAQAATIPAAVTLTNRVRMEANNCRFNIDLTNTTANNRNIVGYVGPSTGRAAFQIFPDLAGFYEIIGDTTYKLQIDNGTISASGSPMNVETPTADTHATTKAYVDTSITTASANYVKMNLPGDQVFTNTGGITIPHINFTDGVDTITIDEAGINLADNTQIDWPTDAVNGDMLAISGEWKQVITNTTELDTTGNWVEMVSNKSLLTDGSIIQVKVVSITGWTGSNIPEVGVILQLPIKITENGANSTITVGTQVLLAGNDVIPIGCLQMTILF